MEISVVNFGGKFALSGFEVCVERYNLVYRVGSASARRYGQAYLACAKADTEECKIPVDKVKPLQQ